MENENFATKDVHVIVACSLPAVHNHNNNNHSTKRVYKGVDCSVILAHCACEMANLPCNFELFNGSRHLEQQNSVSNNNKSSIIGPLFYPRAAVLRPHSVVHTHTHTYIYIMHYLICIGCHFSHKQCEPTPLLC